MFADTEGDDQKRSDSGLFAATRWSVIMQAREKSESALATLCESYRQPLLIYLRSKLAQHGQPIHLAEDQVQGFMLHLLSRDFLQNVSPDKGKFRTFLKSCVDNYLRDLAAKEKAAKRGGGKAVASLDETNEENEKVHDLASSQSAPDKEFDKAWARTLLANSHRRLEQECAAQGRENLYAQIQPIMYADETSSSYRVVGEKLGKSEAAIKVAAMRMRNRLAEIVREEVRQTVGTSEDWEEEVRYLISLFGR